MSLEQRISYTRTARYYLSGEPFVYRPYLCFVLHGYGQLPQFFLRKFSALNRSDILFVAPEGLHRFYLKGSQGRVGASWMTKEDRLTDIADYIGLLDQVAYEVIERQEQPYMKIAILGFSQGVATACRWVAHSKVPFSHLINWAGAFPPDLDFAKAHDRLESIPVDMVLGRQDEFISNVQLEQHLRFLKDKDIHYTTHFFEGKHELNKSLLEKLLAQIFPANQDL